MNQSEYKYCCSECFKDLAAHGNGLAKIWMDICKMSIDKGNFFRVNIDLPIFADLEKYGYVVTTEWEDYIVLRLNGMDYFDLYQVICIKEGNHGDSEDV